MLPSHRVLAHLRTSARGLRAHKTTAAAVATPQRLFGHPHPHRPLTVDLAMKTTGRRAVTTQTVEHAASNNTNSDSIENFTVVRGGVQEGLLMLTLPVELSHVSEDGRIPVLSRGSVVCHEARQWVCAFPIDQYWFAVLLGGETFQHLETNTWRKKSGSSTFAVEPEAILHCLKQATPTQAERAQLCDGVSTGISAVDVLAPLGRGQSMLVCGTKGSGKSTLVCDIMEQLVSSSLFDKIVRFCSDPCAVALDVTEQHRHVYAELSAAPGSVGRENLPESYLLGSLIEAVAAAEASRDAGGHAVLVLDSIAPLTDAWDLGVQWAEAEGGKALDVESVSGQRRSYFANIFERAANVLDGGSLTIVAIVDTDAFAAVGPNAADKLDSSRKDEDDSQTAFVLSDFVGRKETDLERIRRLQDRGVPLTHKILAAIGIAPPSRAGKTALVHHSVMMRELQSLSDGQVVLDKGMAMDGSFPAVVPGTTFSRFGLGSTESTNGGRQVQRDVRPTALQVVSAHLRMEIAIEHDTRFRPPAEGDASATTVEAMEADVAQSTRMEAVKIALLQPRHSHLAIEEMVALLLAACSGAFDVLPREKIVELLRGGSHAPFLVHLRSSAPQVLKHLQANEIMSAEAARELDVAIRLFIAIQMAS